MLKDARCIVFKVGTSTLTHENGTTNIRRMEGLVSVLSDLMNAGIRVALVTSGAIGVGVGRLHLNGRPKDTAEKQAAATVGQCELMYMYDKMFASYGHTAGQLLITRDDIEHPVRRMNLIATFDKLFGFGVVPIINENDAVAVEEIVFGDNDSLSAVVATLIRADALIILTECDGLFDKNPLEHADAKRIPIVEKIDDQLRACAGGSITSMGTGGMITKIHAAEIAKEAGIDTFIINGKDPRDIYRLIEGEDIGTHFKAVKHCDD